MRPHRPNVASLFFALALGALAASSAAAQDWPTRPIRAIVTVSAGSSTDLVARAVFDALAPALGQPIVVEYRLGAGGAVGAASVAKAEPDGYTLLAHSVAIAIMASTVLNAGYDARKDFAAVAPIANVPLVLAAQRKYKTVADLVAAGKARPGALNYASVGYGATAHLVAERFRLAAAIAAQHIPFKGPRARGLHQAPREGPAERADHHRGGLPELRFRLLDRPLPAGEDAAPDRRQTQPRDHEGGAVSRGAGAPRDTRRRADGDDGGRVRRLSARADR